MRSNCYIRVCVSSFLVIVFSVAAFAQSGSVDLTFNAQPSNSLPTDVTFRHIIQPDGKVIVFNAPAMVVNGELRNGMFRLTTDGSIDPTFAYNNEGNIGIDNIMIAPDGKLVLAGATSPNHAKMVRLNPDGSLDNSFSVFIAAVGPPSFTGNWLTVNAIQPDGKVIATHSSWGNIQGTWYSYSMRRYNLNGSIDTSFTSPTLDGGHLVSTTVVAEMLPDARFYLAITSRSHLGGSMSISRRLANGSADPTYNPFMGTIFSSAFLTIRDLSVTTDGGVLATGALVQTAIGFPPQQQLRRYLPDGGGYPGFASPLVFDGVAVHQLSDGKILYSATGGTTTRPLMRLNANGSADDTYVLDPAVTAIKNTWQVDSMNRPVFLAQTAAGLRLVRLLESGSIDPTFSAVLGAPGTTSVVAVQPDGKVLIAGTFTNMNGTPRNRLARVNADGSVDATFDPGTGFNILPRQILVQADGKILAVGTFTTYNGAPAASIARLNSNGSLDATFSVTIAGSTIVDAVALQPDGKIFIGGSFTSVNSVNRPGFARLETNGALDATFNPTFTGTSIKGIIVEGNGQVTIGGTFTDGAGRSNLARLESNGAFDAGFIVAVADVEKLWQQSDGKYLYVHPAGPTSLFRRNTNGSPDASFTSPVFTFESSGSAIRSVVPMPDGSLIVGGRFNKAGTHSKWHLTRLAPNGSHDQTFLTTGANLEVFSVVPHSPGKVIVAGSFNWIDNINRAGIARLNVPEFQRVTPFDFDGDGRADISVVRSSTNRWYEVLSSTGAVYEETFGLAGDVLAPADFDGDGITDEAIFRPSNGHWWYRSSLHGGLTMNPFGGAGDIPRPSDFDGDGKADLVLFRPSSNTWFRYSSLTNSEATPLVFGLAGDQPLVGDFDGDGKSDPAIFRPSNGDWWYAASSAGGAFRTVHWGQNGDIPVPADFDGDGRTDYAVYRPSQGGWYIYNSSNGSFTTTAFGVAGDRPVAADYDGDGRADIAVFRPSTGIWYLLRSTSGFAGYQFGISTDIALPGALIP